MLYAPANVGSVLIVSERRPVLAHGVEVILLVWAAVDISLQHVEVVLLAIGKELYECERIVEVVKDDIVLIEDILQVGRVVLLLRLVLHVDVFEVADSVEGSVAKETASVFVVTLYVEVCKEVGDELSCVIFFADGSAGLAAIGEGRHTDAMLYCHARYGVHTDEGVAVLIVVVVRALHQCALRISVSDSHVYADRRVEVAEDALRCCMVSVHGVMSV